MSKFKFVIVALIILMLNACNTQPKKADGEPITIADVKANIKFYRDRKVRWAGTIVDTKNYAKATEIKILATKLDIFGNANVSGRQQGRFIARFTGFKDPAHFRKNKILTINGTVDSLKAAKIDSYRYVYPVINVNSYKLSEVAQDKHYPRWYWGLGWSRYGRHGGSLGIGW